MKKIIILCITLLVSCYICDAQSTKINDRYITLKEITAGSSINNIDAIKIPQHTQMIVVTTGSSFSRVRVLNGKMNGKYIYVRNIYLKQFCKKL